MATQRLIVIVGPTASGKSALAMELAKKFDGEIICADSRTVYEGMDIGTAKPSQADQKLVTHHLLDVLTPDKVFTAADFKEQANEAIRVINARNKVPILVGGSGLYVDALLYDYQFADGDVPRDPVNPRHVSSEVKTTRSDIRKNTLVIGLSVERSELKERIASRVEQMIEDGFVDEVEWLFKTYPDSKALLAPGYKAFKQVLDGSVTMDEAKEIFIRNDSKLAKRQMTWFKRNKSIHWVDEQMQAVDLATTFLYK